MFMMGQKEFVLHVSPKCWCLLLYKLILQRWTEKNEIAYKARYTKLLITLLVLPAVFLQTVVSHWVHLSLKSHYTITVLPPQYILFFCSLEKTRGKVVMKDYFNILIPYKTNKQEVSR